jgi:hypothetical protein
MEFDFEELRAGVMEYLMHRHHGNEVRCEKEIRPLMREARSFGYRPTGREVMKGVCTTAGYFIRQIMHHLGLEDSIKFSHVTSCTERLANHDTTLVFDRGTGHWAVINSKSPIKPYNLVPKDRLPDLGRPYAA